MKGANRQWGMDSTKAGLARRLNCRCTLESGLDGGSVGGEARAVDLKVLHYTLHVVAGLGERDALDPVDGIDLRDRADRRAALPIAGPGRGRHCSRRTS